MAEFKVVYYAPYTFANFKCEAKNIKEAGQKWGAFNREHSYCISRRELKSVKFDGKEVVRMNELGNVTG